MMQPSGPASGVHEPIAIVGIGCRFPGGIVDPASFWRALLGGVDAITDIPPERFDPDLWYDARPGVPGRIGSRKGGFVGAVEMFDAFLFGISPREAERLDPQQRLLLEVAWEAFHDAAMDPTAQEGLRCGVYVGQWIADYENRLFADPTTVDFHSAQGSGRYSSSGRLSYTFGLQGPSLTLDTGCSSALVGMHLAVQSLRSGESVAALVGGVNLLLEPNITIAYSRGDMMAPDGHSKFGDASANGYVRAEGAAVLLLKRLADAVRDGDRVYAVVAGSAINNDGRSSGLYGRPSQIGQVALLRSAYQDAALDPSALHFVEAHGTGTRAGDPVELGAIAEVVGPRATPLWVGSVKTNFGHTEAVAGLAGLIKASLSLYHGVLPASLHFHEPTPAFDWAGAPVRVPTEPVPLAGPSDRRYGGVSSFGISGTNAHVVLGAGPPAPAGAPKAGALVLPLAAHLPEARTQLAAALADRLDGAAHAEAARIAAVLSRRPALPYRAAVAGADVASLVAGLRALAAQETAPRLAVGQARAGRSFRIALVFPGQGGQWEGMGRRLLATEPAFADAIREIEAALAPLVEWSLTEQLELASDHPAWRLDRIDVIQPVLVAFEIAYARLLRAYGITADAVVGHSMGEVAAACCAGALSLEDAMAVVVHRSRLLRTVAGAGAMAVVELSATDARAAIGPRADRVALAVHNASNASVLSGEPAAVQEILAELDARGVFTRLVKVDVASHSPQMDPLVAPLVEAVAGMAPRDGSCALYSTVEAAARLGAELDPAYWGRNLRNPVRFAETIDRMLDDGYDLFIEVGPHPVLTNAIGRAVEDRGAEAVVLATGRRDEDGQCELLSLLGEAFVAGLPVDWRRVYPDPVDREVGVPPLPMIRQRHWFERPRVASGDGVRLVGGRPAHPFLAAPFDAAAAGVRTWEAAAERVASAWLADHLVRRTVLWPAAASAEGLLAAASEAGDGTNWSLRHLTLREALAVEPGRQVRLQWSARGDARGRHLVLHARDEGDGVVWRQVADALAVPSADGAAPSDVASVPSIAADGNTVGGADLYRRLRERGLEYGAAFQAITEIVLAADVAESRLTLPQAAANDPGLDRFRVHPVLLDGALQTLVAAALGTDDTGGPTPLPIAIGRLDVLAGSGDETDFTVRARITGRRGAGFTGEATLFGADSRPVAVLREVDFTWTADDAAGIDGTLFTLAWEPVELTAVPHRADGVVLVGDEPGLDGLAERLRAGGGRVESVPSVAALDAVPGAGALVWYVGTPSVSAPLVERSERLTGDAVALARRCVESEGRLTRVYVVTQGAVGAAGDTVSDPAAAAARAVARVLGHEQPDLQVTLVDLPAAAAPAEAAPAILADAADAELALRGGRWYAARLDRWVLPERVAAVASAPVSFALELTSPGSPDHLRWVARQRPAPRAGAVEIEVEAVGLNFMNALSVLGAYPGAPNGVGSLGLEGVGRVVRTGAGVTHVAAGDRVLFVAPDAMAQHVVTSGELVVRAPAAGNAETLAGLPIAYLTVHYGLGVLARLDAGERVLIHSAAGGVGLAAIAYARMRGAEVFATAGTAEKRAWLETLGVRHVFDSRSLDWADGVLAATGGEGVDVVLNSLTGQAQERGLAVLRPHGRFVEIGKRDIYDDRPLGLGTFRNSLAFFAVDLDRMIRERPDRVGAMLREVASFLESGQLGPLPVETFPSDGVQDAFRRMLPGTHRGKLVVSLATPPWEVALGVPAAPIRDDATYLVTGGLGALGLVVARWLAERGAGAIVLAGRRPPDETARALLAELAECGTRIETRAADLADRDAVAGLLGSMATLPPLRGIFHLAGALDDAPITALTPERIAVPFRPKAAGGVHLLERTRDQPLDFVVAFSSIASRFGTPGQANYAAANAVLDALAAERDSRLLSINFGPFASIGLAAAEPSRLRALARQGFGALEGEEAVAVLDRLLGTMTRGAVAAVRLDPAIWADGKTAAERAWIARLLAVAPEPVAADASWRDQVAALPPGRARRRELERLLTAAVATTLRLPPGQISADRPLRTLGMDSLLTLEFRKRLERATGFRVGATVFFSHPTIAALAPFVATQWELPLDPPQAAAAPDDAELEALLGDLARLGEDELQALLDEGDAP